MLHKYDRPILMTILEQHLLKDDVIIAGGYARYLFCRETEDFTPIAYGDIDIWSLNEDTYEAALFTLNTFTDNAGEKSPNGWRYSWCGEAYNIIRPNVRKFTSIEDLLSQFDFTVCQAAFDANGLYVTDGFLQDVFASTVRFDKWIEMKDPVEEMARVIKYAAKGFHIHPTVLPAIFTSFDCMDSQDKHAAIDSYKIYRGEAYGV